ncbi:phosphoribosylanthranilate isomerase [Candidatus Daviesbacteria bacterium]|nr:phosphoribosylanthranilate isomerase [Candidatus Daviesbacteria bacterium]
MQVKVKICGIRNIEAAKVATEAGADFLGFNFVPSSKRYINPAIALEIINSVRDKVKVVGVFQNAKNTEVNKIALDLKLDFVQLHGNENNEYINKVGTPVINFITLDDQPEKFRVDYFLLDRPKRGKGNIVDLEKAKKLTANSPLFFAGGLTPDNVLMVVKQVKPFAVDVAGGIETDGHQDLEKIKLFIGNAKGVTL